MLVIEICLHPFGAANKCQVLEEMTIHNTGGNKNRPEYGDYIFKYKYREIKIENYKRDRGPLKLLYKCLEQYFEIKFNEDVCGYNCRFFDRHIGRCDKYRSKLNLIKTSDFQWDYTRCKKCIEENGK